MSDLAFGVLRIALLIPAIVFHEVAHGYVSYRLGDPTAKMAGRLSLNPIKHIDPFGTVILPLILAVGGGPIFGYAKPVPINPRYYRNYRTGMLLTGLAGPATNLALAALSGAVVRVMDLLGAFAGTTPGIPYWVAVVFYYFATINLVLMFFNLIPIPPLDGSRVLPIFLSDAALVKYHQFERYGILIFFVVVLILPDMLGIDPLGAYFDVTVAPVLRLLTGQ